MCDCEGEMNCDPWCSLGQDPGICYVYLYVCVCVCVHMSSFNLLVFLLVLLV